MTLAPVRLALIAAVAANGVIGREGGMPWHLPQDFRYFKNQTMGWPMVMGRRTWASLPGLLPGRPHVVLSSQPLALPQGAYLAADWGQARRLASALAVKTDAAMAGRTPTVFVIGGAQLYALALPEASDLYLTEIAAQVQGDTVFPTWDRSAFVEMSRHPQHGPLQAGGAPVRFDFVHYQRRADGAARRCTRPACVP